MFVPQNKNPSDLQKRRHSKQTLWHIKRRCLWGGRLWWALNTSLTNYNFFRDRRCRSLAFNEIENWCESHATMTGSYCEAALINGATTEERSGTIESKIKKRCNSWKVGTARGRRMAPRFASPVVKKFGRGHSFILSESSQIEINRRSS